MNQIEELALSKKDKVTINYCDHALDLGFALTAWKVQGLTFEFIIMSLDGQKLCSFENLYVVFSRVKTNDGIRCSPLSKSFNPQNLKNKLPNMWTTRWRIDTRSNVKWSSDPSNSKLRMKIKNQKLKHMKKQGKDLKYKIKIEFITIFVKKNFLKT